MTRIKALLTEEDCPCVAVWNKYTGEYYITFCPKHAAADDMLEALERCQRTIRVMYEIAPNYHLEGALEEADTVVARATKKE